MVFLWFSHSFPVGLDRWGFVWHSWSRRRGRVALGWWWMRHEPLQNGPTWDGLGGGLGMKQMWYIIYVYIHVYIYIYCSTCWLTEMERFLFSIGKTSLRNLYQPWIFHGPCCRRVVDALHVRKEAGFITDSDFHNPRLHDLSFQPLRCFNHTWKNSIFFFQNLRLLQTNPYLFPCS